MLSGALSVGDGDVAALARDAYVGGMHTAALLAVCFALMGVLVAWIALPAQASRSTASLPPLAQPSAATS